MKKILLVFLMTLLIASVTFAAGNKKSVSKDLALIEDIKTVQAFKSDPVNEEDLNKIVQAGINAQSAMNKQNWHFSVITNKQVAEEISAKMKEKMAGKLPPNIAAKAGMGDSPVAIVISAADNCDFDAGLVTQLMAVEAILLGYGTKIISSPNIVLNGPDKEAFKAKLTIPSDMSSKAVLLIGKYEQTESDAVTSASTRKSGNEIVSYIK